ncbi:hypothetical protein ACFYN5_36360 [Streptomyces sp. NPDC007126]|uniref:hypothetical protein n=1 Tax=Streptomyces sp. NPDC007126 TaxID=3364774 RepID=UPI0036C4687E
MKGFAESEGEVCPDCKAGPGRENACLGVGTPYQMWHTPDCPQWTIMQIEWEAGSRRIKEQDAWAKEIFPAAHERLSLFFFFWPRTLSPNAVTHLGIRRT